MSTNMQISRSKWQDLFLVVCTRCDRDASVSKQRTTAVARDRGRRFGQQQQSRGILFVKFFFPFLFLAQRERVSFGGVCLSTEMRISQSRWPDSFVVIEACYYRGTSLATICACLATCRSQTTIRLATTVSGNSFSVIIFSFSLSRTDRLRFD